MVFRVKSADEWFEDLVAIIKSLPGLEELTIVRSTDYGAEVYALAKGLALGDIQRALILRDSHPSLAGRFGLMIRADELGVSYTDNTDTEELRAAVLLAERTNIGTLAWYEGIVPVMFPDKVTEARATPGAHGPGSVVLDLYYDGDAVSSATVQVVQTFFNGGSARLSTDRVVVRSQRTLEA